ncbi:YdcF family protein [Halobacillus rhizosphaerae]|uniref:YdcF family protein n=1 Tax=Halobacillus rhizosphaerae TaxID=3064889 RepID=UPI00398AAB63
MTISKTKKIILSILAAVFLLGLSGVVTLFILGPGFLIADSNPKPSDAIILLSGADDRLQQAAELYHEGMADQVVLTNSNEPATTPQAAMEAGIPRSALLEEPNATSTYENALFSKKIMQEQDLHSAIIVTSDYHSRRSKYTFEQVYGDDFDLSYSFSSSYFHPEDGLNKHENRTVFTEYVKLIGYWVRFLFV